LHWHIQFLNISITNVKDFLNRLMQDKIKVFGTIFITLQTEQIKNLQL